MQTFKVVIQREVVEEISVNIQTEDEENIISWCPSSIIYEGIAAHKSPSKWSAVVNELWLDTDRVEAVDKNAEFLLDKMDGDWVLSKIPKEPRIDPRQLPLIKEPKDD